MNDYDAIKVLAKYPLTELRRRQRIAEQQTIAAHKTHNIIALERIQKQMGLLVAAIDKKCFTQII